MIKYNIQHCLPTLLPIVFLICLFFFSAKFIGVIGRGFNASRYRDAEDVFVAKLDRQRLGEPIILVKCFAHVKLFLSDFVGISFLIFNSLELIQRHLVETAESIPELSVYNPDSGNLTMYYVFLFSFFKLKSKSVL